MCLAQGPQHSDAGEAQFHLVTGLLSDGECGPLPLPCAGAILKNRPVCYGTSQLKIRVCAVTRYALLKRPTFKSNKPLDNPSMEISSHFGKPNHNNVRYYGIQP